MKEHESAPFFEMPNEISKNHYAKPYYGSTKVPCPTNESAKKVNPTAIVNSFTKGK